MPPPHSSAYISEWDSFGDPAFKHNTKLHFLWFDQLILDGASLQGVFDATRWNDRISRFTGRSRLERRDHDTIKEHLIDVSAVGGGVITSDWLEELQRGYPRWRKGDAILNTYPEPQDAFEHAHNVLLSDIARERNVDHFEGYDAEQAEGKARLAVDNVRTWTRIKAFVPEAELLCGFGEHRAIGSMIDFDLEVSGLDSRTAHSQKIADRIVPDLSEVDWSDVCAIKRDKSFRVIREKVEELSRLHADVDEATHEFQRELSRVSKAIVLKNRPRPIRALVEGIATNLPISISAAGSLIASYAKFLSAAHEHSNHAWVYAYTALEARLEE